MTLLILFLASLWAGTQNALAGGGSFITLPSLMLTGMDARAANITSTVALFPAQIATGWTGRAHIAGAAGLSFRTRRADGGQMNSTAAAIAQLLISIYGGYFGGGIGFLMLAALTAAGMPVRNAGATKNVLAASMNASAVAIFLFSGDVHWLEAAVLGAGAVAGGLLGAV